MLGGLLLLLSPPPLLLVVLHSSDGLPGGSHSASCTNLQTEAVQKIC